MDLEENFPDAAAFLSTCLLTIVAFMFVVQQTLPSIPYLTLLDGFVYSMLMMVGFQIFLLNLSAVDSIEFGDNTLVWLSLGAWAVIHFFFFVLAYTKQKREMRKLKMNGEEVRQLLNTKKKLFIVQNTHDKWEEFVGVLWGSM